MSNDFYDKQENLVPGFTMDPDQFAEKHSYKSVSMLDSEMLNVLPKQVPFYNTAKILNIYRFPATGNYTSSLTNGGTVYIPILRQSGLGRIRTARVRMTITNGATSTWSLPTPYWLSSWTLQTPSGLVIQTYDPTTDFIALATGMAHERWQMVADLYNSNDYYWNGLEFPASTVQTFYLEWRHGFLDISSFLPAWLNGDMQLLLNFNASTNWMLYPASSSTAGSITTLDLECDMEAMRDSELQATVRGLKRMRTDYVVPWARYQRFTQTVTAGATYSFNLTAISGDVVWGYLAIRYPANGTSLIGLDNLSFKPCSTSYITNSAGLGILGQIPEDNRLTKRTRFGDMMLGKLNKWNNLIIFNFTSTNDGIFNFMKLGQKTGNYPFTTHETATIVMPGSGTSEVVTVTNAAGPGTAGNFAIMFTSPEATCITQPLAYNTSAANIALALEELPNFQGSCTVAGSAGASTSFTITYAGNYENQPMFSRGYALTALPLTLNASGTACPLSAAVTTTGVIGINSGSSYIFDFAFFTSEVVTIEGTGMDVANSAAS